MVLDTYVELLEKKIKKQSSQWSHAEGVSQKELYTFFHSLKGTAGTIGLHSISSYSQEILEQVEEKNELIVDQQQVVTFFSTLEQLLDRGENQSSPLTKKHEGLVLLIDHDADFITQAKPQLEERGFQVSIAITLEKGLGLLYALKPSFILLQIDPSDRKEIRTVKKIVDRARKLFIPIALASDEKSVEQHIYTYEIGATDFIGKPFLDTQQKFVDPISCRLQPAGIRRFRQRRNTPQRRFNPSPLRSTDDGSGRCSRVQQF